MSEALQVDSWVSEYTVCAVPRSYPEWHIWAIKVSNVGGDRWAVRFRSGCIGKRGKWSYEPNPSSRTDRWKNAYRHDLETALKLAEKAAVTTVTNSLTAAQYIDWYDTNFGSPQEGPQ